MTGRQIGKKKGTQFRLRWLVADKRLSDITPMTPVRYMAQRLQCDERPTTLVLWTLVLDV